MSNRYGAYVSVRVDDLVHTRAANRVRDLILEAVRWRIDNRVWSQIEDQIDDRVLEGLWLAIDA